MIHAKDQRGVPPCKKCIIGLSVFSVYCIYHLSQLLWKQKKTFPSTVLWFWSSLQLPWGWWWATIFGNVYGQHCLQGLIFPIYLSAKIPVEPPWIYWVICFFYSYNSNWQVCLVAQNISRAIAAVTKEPLMKHNAGHINCKKTLW